MHRIAPILCVMLLLVTVCHGQSLADAARENRKQKATDGSGPAKVVTSDDLSAPREVTIRLVPGSNSTGQGTLVAPGRGKHSYSITHLDATRFTNGGTLHIEVALENGAAEASFDLFPEGARLPSGGFPKPLASAHNVPIGTNATIDYHFDHGSLFEFAAEGSWNVKAGDTNTYGLTVDVGNR